MGRPSLLTGASHFIGFALAAAIVVFSIGRHSDVNGTNGKKILASRTDVLLLRYSLPKDARGSPATFTIENTKRTDVRELTIRCSRVMRSGKITAEAKTVQVAVKAKSNRTIAIPGLTPLHSEETLVGCSIDGFQLERVAKMADAPTGKRP